MNRFGLLLTAVAAALIVYASPSQSTTGGNVLGFNNIANFRLNTTTGGTNATVAGYGVAGDGGGGSFYDLGTVGNGTGQVCYTYTNVSATIPSGSLNTLNLTTTAGLVVGEAITGISGFSSITFPQGAQVASIPTSTSITMTLAASGSGTGFVTISGDNGGTLIIDSEPSNPGPGHQCWQKAYYRGEPHEWGAKGDGTTNDTLALQNWLGAYGNVYNAPGAPANFGPWIATIPANYLTNAPLTCPPNAHLQAIANDSRESGSPDSPLIQIGVFTSVNSGFTGGTATNPIAVLKAEGLCRISGLSIDAIDNNSCTQYTNCYVDAVNIDNGGVVIDNHSILQQGYYNVFCPNKGAGLQLKDSQFDQSYNDNIHLTSCANTRIIGVIVSLAGNPSGTPIPSSTAAGIYFDGEDLTVSNGNVEQSQGIGIQLGSAANSTFATDTSITGMFVEKSGLGGSTSFPGGAGLEIDGGKEISVCGNHFSQNDSASVSSSAHIRLNVSGTSPKDISFCGNVYRAVSSTPNYVYDVIGTTGVGTDTLYECPQAQVHTPLGVFSPNAVMQQLPGRQVSPPAGTCPQ